MTLKTAYFKDDDGDVTEVTTMHEIDAFSAVARFPWQWSFDADKFAKPPAPAKAKGKPFVIAQTDDGQPAKDAPSV